MIPLFKRIWHAFLYDELAVTRWLRGAMMTCAAGGVAFADQIAAAVHAPHAVQTIKVVAAACAFVGGSITAGERNPRE